MKTFHCCLNIEGALKQRSLRHFLEQDGKPLSDKEVRSFLSERQAQGKKYFTGCDNETEEGRCGGHE